MTTDLKVEMNILEHALEPYPAYMLFSSVQVKMCLGDYSSGQTEHILEQILEHAPESYPAPAARSCAPKLLPRR